MPSLGPPKAKRCPLVPVPNLSGCGSIHRIRLSKVPAAVSRATTPDDRPVLPWSILAPILMVHLFGTLGFALAIPFLVFIVDELGGAGWTYGLLGATYSAFQLVGAPVLGRWSDRTGRRPVLVASQAGTLCSWLLFLVALSLPAGGIANVAGATVTFPLLLVFAARSLDGVTGGNISVANAYVADLTRNSPKVRQIAFGRMGMAGNLGFVIGPATAGLLGGTLWGPRLPIAVAAVMAAVTIVAIVLWLREPDGRCPRGPKPPSALEAGLSQQAKPCDRAQGPSITLATFAHGPVAAILIATFVLFLGFNFFYAGFPVHAMQAYGWDTGQLGAYFAILSGMMIVAQGPLLSFVSRHLGSRVVFGTGIACLVCSLLLLAFPPGPLTYVSAGLFAVGNGLSWPTFQARVADVAGDEQGAIQGAATSASSLASIAGLVVGGILYTSLESRLFYVAAALFTVVLVLTPVWFPYSEKNGQARQKVD